MSILRPNFTNVLIKALEKNSLNIYGTEGQGQLRLLEDLQLHLKTQGDLVFLIQMKNHTTSYRGYIQELRGCCRFT